MARAVIVFIFLTLVLIALDDKGGNARPRNVSSNIGTRSRGSAKKSTIDPDGCISDRIEFGDSPEQALKAFGEPTRHETSSFNREPSLKFAYDDLGLYLLFVEKRLYRVLVSSKDFSTTDGLRVGSTFSEVHGVLGKNRFVANGVFAFEMQKRTPYTGRYYFTESGRVVQFLAPWPNDGADDKGSDDQATLILFAASYAP